MAHRLYGDDDLKQCTRLPIEVHLRTLHGISKQIADLGRPIAGHSMCKRKAAPNEHIGGLMAAEGGGPALND